MKRIILLGFLLLSVAVSAQDIDSTGVCKANFKFAVNPNIYTFAPATAIDFFDTSEGEVIAWFWDFGDKNTSAEQNPMFIFNHPLGGPDVKINPYRNVRLTITTADSCTSTTTQTINIMDVPGDVSQTCKAVFKYYEMSRDSAGGTATIHFDNYSEGKELTYFWEFGDGSASTEKDPVVKFSLDQPEYKVCLTINSADSCSSIFCDAIYVQPPVMGDSVYSDTIQPGCFAAFGFNKKDVLMGPLPSMLVEFYSKAHPDPTEWHWDFGDGTTSNEPNPTHTYIQSVNADTTINDSVYNIDPDQYHTVCLTIMTADGCTISYCETIQVFGSDHWTDPEPEKCPVYFKYYQPDDVMSIPEVVPIKLVDVSEGDVISRYWLFEDGSVSTEKEPLVMFDIFQPVHKACLTVTFADSCTNTFCDYVYINRGITDSVIVDPQPVNWWLSGEREKIYIRSDAAKGMNVTWRLCDGTLVEADSIPLEAINCGGDMSNMIVTDSLGNIVYSETISLKGSVTGIEEMKVQPTVKLWPNPVSSILNIRYLGEYQSEINVEICDIMGKRISSEIYSNITDGHEFNINTESLKQGIYFCKISSAGKVIKAQKFSRR